MKILTTLFLGMMVLQVPAWSLANPKTPTKPILTQQDQFNKQVDKTNVAMALFAKTNCTDSNFGQLANNFSDEIKIVYKIYDKLPYKTMDELIFTRDTEILQGMLDLAVKFTDAQQECTNKAASKPNSSISSNTKENKL